MSETVKMEIEVTFDSDATDAESVSNALDILLETTMSTPGILSEYGNPSVGKFIPILGPWVVEVTQVVDKLSDSDDADTQPAGSGGKGSSMTYAMHYANSEKEAGDIFHEHYPIGNLEDFEFDYYRAAVDQFCDDDCYETPRISSTERGTDAKKRSDTSPDPGPGTTGDDHGPRPADAGHQGSGGDAGYLG